MAALYGYYQLSPRAKRCKFVPRSPDSSRGFLPYFHLPTKREKYWPNCISAAAKKDALQERMIKHSGRTSISFQKGIILANALLFIFPFQTSAETCKTDNTVQSMPLLFSVALIGAAVGGFLARRRRVELKRVNDQLRQINETFRRQAKIESYAPDLSYAPVGRITSKEVVVDPRKEQLLSSLRTGKSFLRMQDLERATVEFRLALELAQVLGDHPEEKKAARGLGASLQRQGKHKEAIKQYTRVLEISESEGEDSATTEAYGAIADCFTEPGDLEQAAKFYDKYIQRLEDS